MKDTSNEDYINEDPGKVEAKKDDNNDIEDMVTCREGTTCAKLFPYEKR